MGPAFMRSPGPGMLKERPHPAPLCEWMGKENIQEAHRERWSIADVTEVDYGMAFARWESPERGG
jgi:hypothetical protein